MRKLGVEQEGLEDALESAKSRMLGEESGNSLGKGKERERKSEGLKESLAKELQTGVGSETAEGSMEASEGGGPPQANRL
jgi:hypothetical protein